MGFEMKYGTCKHCNEHIYKSHGSWKHTILNTAWCMVTIATPKKEEK